MGKENSFQDLTLCQYNKPLKFDENGRKFSKSRKQCRKRRNCYLQAICHFADMKEQELVWERVKAILKTSFGNYIDLDLHDVYTTSVT